jgi:hypothetical protein
MITLGYGDIVPVSTLERTVVIIIALISCGMFAYTFNRIGAIFQSLNERKYRLNKKL